VIKHLQKLIMQKPIFWDEIECADYVTECGIIVLFTRLCIAGRRYVSNRV